MKTTLEKAKELLESQSAKSIEKTIDRAIGLALVSLAEEVARVATALEISVSKHKKETE
ncbi:unnamed protein product [marine sediment metagenome]|uniref:Uncharacterized protein n=1 Tax=marine sediment metagenome TaxID=412755 RepID=X1NQV5_9ZZZZ